MRNSPSASHAFGAVCGKGRQHSSFKAAYCVLFLVVGTVVFYCLMYSY